MNKAPIKVGVIGSGTIGIDLVERMLHDSQFEVEAFIGRRSDSPGLIRFHGKVKKILHDSDSSLLDIINDLDGVFDATSAFDHKAHWKIVSDHDKWIIDLTPSRIGQPIVPTLINKIPAMEISKVNSTNYSMVTCGGQSSAPIIQAISKNADRIDEVEVSSSISALSAGPATRLNIDQYIDSTEHLITLITACTNVKVILVLNPADPPVLMRTTVQVAGNDFDINGIMNDLKVNISAIKNSVPGYVISVEPHFSESNVVSCTAKIEGAGYYLPKYSGNLDIINAAAVETAKLHSRNFNYDK